MNLYLKFVLLGLSLVVFTSVTIFLFVNNTVENNLEESILAEHSQKADISINNIDRFIYERLNDVKNFAKLPVFRKEDPDLVEVNRTLSEISHANELYYIFSFFDMNPLADSKGLSVGKQHGLRLYWTHINDNIEEQEIEQHSFNLSSNDTFYLYSDGFKDQIGGKEHKKYLPKRFRLYLGMIVKKAMMIQKNLLEKELQDWKQDTPQTDDMLVMGFRVK